MEKLIEKPEFENGDIVYIKKHEHAATIAEITEDWIECSWFVGDELHRDKYQSKDLEFKS